LIEVTAAGDDELPSHRRRRIVAADEKGRTAEWAISID
jgi:hypothetical protein